MDAQASGEIRSSCPFADSRPDGCICIALRDPKRVSIDYQARFCLTDRHVHCRRFQRAVPEVPAAEPSRRLTWGFEPRTFAIAGGVAVVIILLAAAFTFQGTWAGWFKDGTTSTPSAGSAAVVDVQPTTIILGDAPSATPDPSEIPVLVATPTEVATEAASVTSVAVVDSPTAVPTVALSPTATPEPALTPSPTATPAPPPPSPTPSPTVVSPPSPTPAVAQTLTTPATHTVVSGETLNSISQAYNVPVSLIAAANGLSDVDVINSGATLYIPNAAGIMPPGAPVLGVHIVAAGDTLSAIASSFGVTVQNVMAENGIADASHIEIGQVILIPRGNVAVQATPVPQATQTPQVTYTVKPGDDLYSIAKHFGVTIESLMSANGLTDRTYVRSGQVLVIPSS